MNMINLFLRFTNEDVWRTYAIANNILTVVEDVDQWNYYSHDHAINDIGELFNDDGVYDPDTGEVITPPTPKPGWHVNWKATAHPADINTYVVTPLTPHNVWAGD